MMKAVLRLDLHDDKAKKKAMQRVTGLPGVDSISMDMKDKKLTVTGDIDAVVIVAKLRKLCHTDIISVGPAKEPEKKKEEPKKPEGDKKDPVAEWVKAYQTYNPYLTTHYHVRSVEEDPNACKAVLKLDLHDDKDKKKAMQRVTGLPGVDSISMDMKDKKLTVIGDIDAVVIVAKLRKLCHTDIISKAVLKLDLHDEKTKKKAMKTVSSIPAVQFAIQNKSRSSSKYLRFSGLVRDPKCAGVDSISMDMKDQKLTVVGDIDPVHIVAKLRKLCCTEIVTKAVLKVELHDAKAKKKAMKIVSGLPGVESVSIEMKDKKMTVTGDVDPVNIVAKLRKLCHTEIITVGPAKEPEKKKEEPKKDPADPVANYLEMQERKYLIGIGITGALSFTGPTILRLLTELLLSGFLAALSSLPHYKSTTKNPSHHQVFFFSWLFPCFFTSNFLCLLFYLNVFSHHIPLSLGDTIKLELHDAKAKKKAMKTVSRLPVSIEMKDKKLTVIGDIDPVHIVAKLRELCHTEIITVGPAKEPEKKKDEPKKEEPKNKDPADPVAKNLSCHPQMPLYYYVSRVEDNQKACKAVLKLDLHDEKARKKAMKTVSSLPGVDSISMDMKDQKLTVIGDIDAADIVAKLRKLCHTDIISVGPAKEPEKKKEEPKKPDLDVAECVKACKAYNPHITTYYYVRSVEDNPNACVYSLLSLRSLTINTTTKNPSHHQKAVLKLDLHDDKAKKKAMVTVSGFPGVESVSIEMKDKKMTVTGDVDPVHIVAKLRKLCHTEIITVEPAKEPEKKKDEPKKEDDLLANYLSYHPPMPQYYYVSRVEDNQNACVIS
ncbi:hypothetical protein SADUNF_Sadunf17G0133200 [Salix dunnii]|uniref:HMA domain-containing protein n=1 Tax=Salix dunnii TaxID=1413687 RepID=A0A835J873_9ROSI|nr:hypothetical protein SADUNF_Sadunf17G0133200 [Salix dunnii]